MYNTYNLKKPIKRKTMPNINNLNQQFSKDFSKILNQLNRQFSKDFSKILNQKFIITEKTKCFFIDDNQYNILQFFYLEEGDLYVELKLIICTKIEEDYIEGYDLIKENFERFKISNILKIENHLKELETFKEFKQEYFQKLGKILFKNNTSYFCDLETLESEEMEEVKMEEVNFPKKAVDNLSHFLRTLEPSDFKIVETEK